MKRRTFIVTALASAAGIAGTAAWRLARSDAQQAVIAVLRKRLGYLRLESAGLYAFARDMVAHRDFSLIKLRLLSASNPLYESLTLAGTNFVSANVRHGEERITTTFLLSTDFFASGADCTRMVRYLGYYDPLQACRNPFAVPVSSTATTNI